MIYLDAAATRPVRREAIEAMWPYLTGEFGNPSSVHALGSSAASALADARDAVASWLGGRPGEVTFTSGGTEADNLAIKGIALAAPRGRHVVTSAIEHEAVRASAEHLVRHHGFEHTVVGVDREGRVRLDDLAAAVRDDTTLVSVLHGSNEVGTVQPIARIAAIAHTRGVPVHTDAVQTAGVLPLDVRSLGVDAVSVSGHKLGAPKGVGALWVRAGVPVEPVLHGGGQERGRRSGTENVAFAVALAVAARLSRPDDGTLAARTRRFVDAVLAAVPEAVPTGARDERIPGHASFLFPGMSGESVLVELEARGVLGSSGSACAAGRDEPSPVLLAMGYAPAVAQTAVRLSFDGTVADTQLAAAASALGQAVEAVRVLA